MKFLFLILISFSLSAQINKTEHFYASALGAALLSEVNYRITKKPAISAILSAIEMFSIGWCKEKFHDKVFSTDDLYPDAFGSATGSLVWGVHYDITDRSYKHKMKELDKLNKTRNLL